MVSNLYCLQDAVAKVFMQPFMAGNDDVAVRSFRNAIQKGQGSLADNPGEFNLYLIGTYDDQVGFVSAVTPIDLVVTGAALVSTLKGGKDA